MADPYYSVVVQLGDPDTDYEQSWTVTHTGDPHASDSLAPVAGLRFGWKAQESILWPLAPEPMTAAFAINVPDFTDIAWVGEDVPVAIEVRLEATADVAFAFYGRLTDVAAQPRRGRTGVTLSCIAVDYTVDLTRGSYEGPTHDTSDPDYAVLSDVWADDPDLFGDEPWDFGGGPIPVHSVIIPNAVGASYDAIVGPVLAQMIKLAATVPSTLGGGTDGELMFLAPNIDPATRLPDADQPWALDKMYKHAHTRHTIDAGLLDKSSLGWGRNKRATLDTIAVVLANGTVMRERLGAPPGELLSPFILSTDVELHTVTDSSAHGYNIGAFYLRNDVPSRRPWNVTTVRYLLDQIDPSVYASTFPLNLMPRWTQPPVNPGAATVTDTDRATCYGTLIELDGVLDHVNPYSAETDPTLLGLLSSADFAISGGRPSLTLGFRQIYFDTSPVFVPGAFGRSGYGIAPYGALAPVPA